MCERFTFRAKCRKSSLLWIWPTMHVLLKYGLRWRTMSPDISDLNFSLIFFAAELLTSMHSFESDVFFFLIMGLGDLQWIKHKNEQKSIKIFGIRHMHQTQRYTFMRGKYAFVVFLLLTILLLRWRASNAFAFWLAVEMSMVVVLAYCGCYW